MIANLLRLPSSPIRLGITGPGGLPPKVGKRLGRASDVQLAEIKVSDDRSARIRPVGKQFTGYSVFPEPVGPGEPVLFAWFGLWIAFQADDSGGSLAALAPPLPAPLGTPAL